MGVARLMWCKCNPQEFTTLGPWGSGEANTFLGNLCLCPDQDGYTRLSEFMEFTEHWRLETTKSLLHLRIYCVYLYYVHTYGGEDSFLSLLCPAM